MISRRCCDIFKFHLYHEINQLPWQQAHWTVFWCGMNVTQAGGCQINLKEITLKLMTPDAGQIFSKYKAGEKRLDSEQGSVLIWPNWRMQFWNFWNLYSYQSLGKWPISSYSVTNKDQQDASLHFNKESFMSGIIICFALQPLSLDLLLKQDNTNYFIGWFND